MDFAQDFKDKVVTEAYKVRALEASAVNFIRIDESAEGQRLDNFLLARARGVPKSHIYRVVRSGEVRVNKKRASVDTRLELGDIVRVPPLRVSQKETSFVPAFSENSLPIVFEDSHLLIVNKPAGLAAHGGSGVSFGLIEKLRATRPEAPFLELAHRLDRDTSGLIIVAKTRKALVRLQQMQREGHEIEKIYLMLVTGDWVNEREHVKLPLKKFTLKNGERRVRVDKDEGLFSHTIFTLKRRYGRVSLLEAELKTGRTHQIRVHAAASGFPLVGDDKYGDYELVRRTQSGEFLGKAFKRMFLHARSLSFIHPVTQERVRVEAPLDAELQGLLDYLETHHD